MVTTPDIWKALHRVNQTGAGNQSDPAFVDIGMGRYAAVWTEGTGGPIGTSPGIDLVGQIFDANGDPVGTEFQVNQGWFSDDEQDAALATRPDGGFVMVYEDTDGAGTSIRAETYNNDGIRITAGAPSSIAGDPGADTLANPTIAMRDDGSYLVAYQRGSADDIDIVGRTVSTGGVVSGEFFIFNSSDNTTNPELATLSNGNYVIVFQDEFNGDGSDRDIRFTILTPTGTPVIGAYIATANDETQPHVAALTGGGFVAVWRDDIGDGAGNPGIKVRIYDNTGTTVTGVLPVNTTTAGDQNEPVVAALKDGGFVVTWDDDSANLLRGQRFDAAGNKVGDEFIAGSQGSETWPAIAMLGDGRFIVGYGDLAGDGDIRATIFDPRDNTIEGTGGDEVITSRVDGATVKGKNGKDILLGQDADDKLKGGKGNDTLAGGLGKDTMWGNSGKDKFVFDTALGGDNKDRLKDFNRKKDEIRLDKDIFTALGNKVGKKEFVRDKKAQDGNDHLVYDKKKGKVYYDEDGKGGTGQVLFARLDKGTKLKHKDFDMIDELVI